MDFLKRAFFWEVWLPRNASEHGAEIDEIYRLIYAITGVAFVLVMVLLIAFMAAYRHREGRKAVYNHGNSALEMVWTLVPAVILIWLAFHSNALWERQRGKPPPADLVIGVKGKQFNWLVYYPGPDGKLWTADDVERSNAVDVPVGKMVRIQLRSHDVIHSFFLPNMRLKQDMVPGRTIEVWFRPVEAGKYDIACAELCGNDHSTMRGVLTVHTDYEKWLKAQAEALFPAAAPVGMLAEGKR